MSASTTRSVTGEKWIVSKLAAISGWLGILCAITFWVLMSLSSYVRVPQWLAAQLSWQVALLGAVILAVFAALLRFRFRWVALVLTLGTFLLVMYAAGV